MLIGKKYILCVCYGQKTPVHLSPFKYTRAAKHIAVIYNGRYIFVLFNEKHDYEFKKLGFWYLHHKMMVWIQMPAL